MTTMITRAATTLNGITIAYVMGFANALFGVLVTFGVTLTDSEIAAVDGLLNAFLILAFHFGHRVGEATASGSATSASHRQIANAIDAGPDGSPPEAPAAPLAG